MRLFMGEGAEQMVQTVGRVIEFLAHLIPNESEMRLWPLSTTRPLVACHVISLSQSH